MKFVGLVLVAVLIASVYGDSSSIFIGKRIDGDQVIAVQHRASEFFDVPTNYTYTFDYKGNDQVFNITGFHVDLQTNMNGSGVTLKDIIGGVGETFLNVVLIEHDVMYVNSIMRIYGFMK